MIVGTAGHIDHGKSSLVRSLTGVDTDRLKEEKARGISIDLGFAYAPAPDGSALGFVDVPGHEKFVHTMLAGATGVDFVLLVVAADDGIMPQTREHLAILDLLGLDRGIVALTKIDMVPPERVAEVSDDLENLLATSSLAGAEIAPVSSATGAGVDVLREKLFAASDATRARSQEGAFRFAVDRSFTLSGAGTVVTGIVLSGEVSVGDRVVVSPSGRPARVRNIHAQNRPAERGRAGERCALNLAGEAISKDAIARGDFVLAPELHAPTERIDVSFRLLSSERKSIAQWTPIRLHHAASDIAARIVLLGDDPIAPGDQAFAQLVLEKPIAAAVGDRFVARLAPLAVDAERGGEAGLRLMSSTSGSLDDLAFVTEPRRAPGPPTNEPRSTAFAGTNALAPLTSDRVGCVPWLPHATTRDSGHAPDASGDGRFW